MSITRIADTADVSPDASIGQGIVDLAPRPGPRGRDPRRDLRRRAGGLHRYRRPDRRNVKIQNYALVYEPARVEDGAFIGPAAVFTNDHFPRSVNPDGSLKSGHDWEPVGVTVREGASIGARAVCVAPVTIGRWALVAAGATVVRDVPDFALVVGSPARRIGWVGRAGVPLVQAADDQDLWVCPTTGAQYRQVNDNQLEEC